MDLWGLEGLALDKVNAGHCRGYDESRECAGRILLVPSTLDFFVTRLEDSDLKELCKWQF